MIVQVPAPAIGIGTFRYHVTQTDQCLHTGRIVRIKASNIGQH